MIPIKIESDLTGIKPFQDIKINGCAEVAPDVIEACEDSEAEFWSVYLHLENGEWFCIADCGTKQEAEAFEVFLLEIIRHSKIV